MMAMIYEDRVSATPTFKQHNLDFSFQIMTGLLETGYVAQKG
jgi:hypothetical protein